MKIVWDEPKRLANLAKHRLDFAELDEAFFEGATLLGAKRKRLMAINSFQNRMVTVIFAVVGTEAIAVISMRLASAGERSLRE